MNFECFIIEIPENLITWRISSQFLAELLLSLLLQEWHSHLFVSWAACSQYNTYQNKEYVSRNFKTSSFCYGPILVDTYDSQPGILCDSMYRPKCTMLFYLSNWSWTPYSNSIIWDFGTCWFMIVNAFWHCQISLLGECMCFKVGTRKEWGI